MAFEVGNNKEILVVMVNLDIAFMIAMEFSKIMKKHCIWIKNILNQLHVLII